MKMPMPMLMLMASRRRPLDLAKKRLISLTHRSQPTSQPAHTVLNKTWSEKCIKRKTRERKTIGIQLTAIIDRP